MLPSFALDWANSKHVSRQFGRKGADIGGNVEATHEL